MLYVYMYIEREIMYTCIHTHIHMSYNYHRVGSGCAACRSSRCHAHTMACCSHAPGPLSLYNYIYIYTHTYTHTYIHTYIYT